MAYLTDKAARLLPKKLKRILQEELSEETRLGHCQQAIAEGFDYSSASEMFARVPEATTWNRDWCINRLVDMGHVSSEANAIAAVSALEDRYGQLISRSLRMCARR